MKHKIYTLYDVKTNYYLLPVYAQSEKEMVRNMFELVENGKGKVAQYPEDYSLVWLGEYDETNGNIEMLPAKITIGTVMDLWSAESYEIKKARAIRQAVKEDLTMEDDFVDLFNGKDEEAI